MSMPTNPRLVTAAARVASYGNLSRIVLAVVPVTTNATSTARPAIMPTVWKVKANIIGAKIPNVSSPARVLSETTIVAATGTARSRETVGSLTPRSSIALRIRSRGPTMSPAASAATRSAGTTYGRTRLETGTELPGPLRRAARRSPRDPDRLLDDGSLQSPNLCLFQSASQRPHGDSQKANPRLAFHIG